MPAGRRLPTPVPSLQEKDMKDETRPDKKLVEAFHLMFDHFPEGAQLAHKSKRVVAVNPACKAMGRDVGMICAEHGPPEGHTGCLAAEAVKKQRATYKKSDVSGGRESTIFWLPVNGYPDFYIHFGVGYMKEYDIHREDG
jgi:hypothetical protein